MIIALVPKLCTVILRPTMGGKHTQKSGFTIVELLIVIVVIGILAAITIVAFNGVQARAKNQQTATTVASYYKALKLYAVDNSSLPGNSGCLGTPEFYASNPCYIGSSTHTYSSALSDALSPYIKDSASLPAGRSVSGSVSASGIFYFVGGKYIGFTILSSNTCPTIAGASLQSQTPFGSDVYCRIDFPTF